MANEDIPNPTKQRNPFSRCSRCGVEYKMLCFPQKYPWEWQDVCCFCLHPKWASKLNKKNVFYASREGMEYKQALRTAASAKRRACQPPWADEEAIKIIYAAAKRISRKTGILHHVDHIIPVNHPDVCGLHIPQNLQVITAKLNLKKGNKRIQKNW